jgi:hypothetical protein
MSVDGFVLPIVGYVGTVIGVVWTFAWRLSGMKSSVDRRIDAVERMVSEKEASLKGEIVRAIDELSRVMGEGVAAVRQKTHDMEVYGERNFVNRVEHQNMIESFTRSIDALRTEMNAGYLRLDSKLDRLLKEQ